VFKIFKRKYNISEETPEISAGDIISIISNPYVVLEGTYISTGIITSIEPGEHNTKYWCVVYIYNEVWMPSHDEYGELLQSPLAWRNVPCQIHTQRAYTKDEMVEWIREGKVEVVFRVKDIFKDSKP